MIKKRSALILILFSILLSFIACTNRVVEEEITYQLTMKEPEGQGEVKPEVGSYEYNKDDIDLKKIKAEPAAEYIFIKWEGEVADENKAETTVKMDEDRILRAIFKPKEEQKFKLTVEKSKGEGHTIPNPGVHKYEFWESVNLTAEPASGYTFVTWEGIDSDSQIRMYEDKTIRAIFAKEVYELTVNDVLGAGNVSVKTKGDKDGKTYKYETETDVELEAEAEEGHEFIKWRGDVEGDEKKEEEITITVDRAKNIQAVFSSDNEIEFKEVASGKTAKDNGDLALKYDIMAGKYSLSIEEYLSIKDFEIISIYPRYYNIYANEPVTRINFYDALEYANKLSEEEGLEPAYEVNRKEEFWELKDYPGELEGYRLATADEWEYLARGGVDGEASKYAGSDVIDDVAWHRGSNVEQPQPVGQKQANELGLYDLSGNVYEMTSTNYREYMDDDDYETDLITRGGSWDTSKEEAEVTAINRELGLDNSGDVFRLANEDFGFRLVRTKEPGEYNEQFEFELKIKEAERGGGKVITPDSESENYAYREEVQLKAEADDGYEFAYWDGDVVDEQSSETTMIMDEDKTIRPVFIPEDVLDVDSVRVSSGTTAEENGELTLNYDLEVARYPVTYAEYDASNLDHAKHDNLPSYDEPMTRIEFYDAIQYANFISEREGLKPAYEYNVTGDRKDWWWDLKDYPGELEGYRLPTADEWEYAARGGKDGESTKYAGSDAIDEVAWYQENSNWLQAVGQLEVNELGIYDMSGNVYEMTSTNYAEYMDDDDYGKDLITRGGSWNSQGDNLKLAEINTVPGLVGDDDFRIGNDEFGFRLLRTKNPGDYIKHKLEVEESEGGEVKRNPEGSEYKYRTEVELTAQADLGYEFVKWQGDIAEDELEDEQIEILIDQTKTVKAIFEVSEDDIEITSIEELKMIGEKDGLALDASYKLTDDIDLSETKDDYNNGKGWEPIGNQDDPFTGTFVGQGYEISGLYINRPEEDNVGFFGVLGEEAEVSNLKLVDLEVEGNENVGGLAGKNNGEIKDVDIAGDVRGNANHVGGLVGENFGDINHSFTEGEVVSDGNRVGGLVGQNEEADIIDSASISNVEGNERVGGLVGNSWRGDISDSYATGNVEGGSSIGGLVGRNDEGVIVRSYAQGKIDGNNWLGGLVGGLEGEGIIKKSYALGDVKSNFWMSYAGGLVGHSEGEIINSYAQGYVRGEDYVGGLAGRIDKTTGSYSTGNVQGDSSVGGLAGIGNSSEVEKSYWDIEISEQEGSEGGEGKTTEEMQEESTFADWDFDNVWMIDEGASYPYLQWEVE